MYGLVCLLNLVATLIGIQVCSQNLVHIRSNLSDDLHHKFPFCSRDDISYVRYQFFTMHHASPLLLQLVTQQKIKLWTFSL